ncbi:hypothetical protein AYI70_g10333 [Smittium culicis]|uniref:Uncharacterized protein n=1 Tax=Smittium culicis TaxID=133412 RepID=A0A1R1X716_9FUNG|nr:hypothetical protein AYI70_g10333 [Smittium culicis]
MIQKVLDHGYGRVGKLKFEILADQTDYSDSIYDLDIKLLRQTAPSTSSSRTTQIDAPHYLAALKLKFPVIYELLCAQFGKSHIVTKLPSHRLVLANNARNLQALHIRKLIAKLYAPLPLRTIIDIQTRAAAGPPSPSTSSSTTNKTKTITARPRATLASTYKHLDYAQDLAENLADLANNNTGSINERLNFQYISRPPTPTPTSASTNQLTKIPHLRLYKKSYMNLLDKCPYIYFIPIELSTSSSSSSDFSNAARSTAHQAAMPETTKHTGIGPASDPAHMAAEPREHVFTTTSTSSVDNPPPQLTIKRALDLAASSPTTATFVIRKSLWSTSPIPTLTMKIDASSKFL